MSTVTVQNDEKLRCFFEAIFTDRFMQTHSSFEKFEYFRYSSAVIVNWDAELMVYDEALLDLFVQESTVFHSFDEMIRAASQQYFTEKEGN